MMSSKEISPSLFTSTCFSSHLWPHFDLPPPLISHWQEFILMHDPPIFISFPLLTGFWASFSLDLPLVISPPNLKMGFPWWLSGKESACQCRRRWFNSWVRKIPWRRKWLPSPGKSLGQRSLVGYSPWDCRRVRWLSNSTMTTTTWHGPNSPPSMPVFLDFGQNAVLWVLCWSSNRAIFSPDCFWQERWVSDILSSE